MNVKTYDLNEVSLSIRARVPSEAQEGAGGAQELEEGKQDKTPKPLGAHKSYGSL